MTPIRDWKWTHWVLVIGIVLVVLLAGMVIYVITRPTVFVPTAPVTQVPPTGGLPQAQPGAPAFPPSPVEQIPLSAIQGTNLQQGPSHVATGGLTQVTDLTQSPTEFVSLASNGSSINYYDPSTSHFVRVNSDGSIEKISNQVFAEVSNVTYAPNSSDAILEFPDGSNILYNLDTGDQVTLPPHWENFAFSSDSSNIAFKSIGLDPSQNFLAVASKNGGSAKQVAFLGENDAMVNVDWAPNNQVVATYSKPDGLTNSQLYFVGFNGENFPYSELQGLKFEGTWTPTGDKLLYSVTHQDDDFKPRLWLVDGSGTGIGQNRHSINLETWTNKCAFADDTTVYCGVPTNLPEGAGLIPSVADDIPDRLYKVNLTNGQVSQVAIPNEDLNVQSMTVSEDKQSLYIQDRFTGKLEKVRLPA